MRGKWSAILALLATAPLAAALVVSATLAERAVVDQVRRHLVGVADLQSRSAEVAVERAHESLALIVSRTQLRLSLAEHVRLRASDPEAAAGELERIQRIIDDARRSVDSIRGISIIDADAKIVASSLRPPGLVDLRGVPLPADPERTESFVFASSGSAISFFHSGPLQVDGVTIGRVVLETERESLSALTAGFPGLARTGESYFVADVPGLGLRAITPRRFTVSRDLSSEIDRKLAAGETGFFGDMRDERGARVLVYLSDSAVPGWRLVVKVDRDEALAGAFRVRVLLGTVIAALAVLAGAATMGLARSMQRDNQRLAEESTTDQLTCLYNRRGFMLHAQQHYHLAIRRSAPFSLYFFDLDRLKRINDSLGHNAGDLAIVTAAAALRDTFRESDVIGRLGGDEFAVLAADSASQDDVIRRRLEERLVTNAASALQGMTLTMSVGRSRFDGVSPRSLESMLREADGEMYRFKASRRGNAGRTAPQPADPGRDGDAGKPGANGIGQDGNHGQGHGHGHAGGNQSSQETSRGAEI